MSSNNFCIILKSIKMSKDSIIITTIIIVIIIIIIIIITIIIITITKKDCKKSSWKITKSF